MLFRDFRARGPIRIPPPPIVFFHDDAWASVHPLPKSWYLIPSLWVYLCSWMHIMAMLWSMADAVSSGSCPILFKVLTLNVFICIIRLHFSNFHLSSVAEARDTTSAGRAFFFTRAKSDVVWICGLSMNRRVRTSRTRLGISLSRRKVYLLAFMSTVLLPMAFENFVGWEVRIAW